MSPIEKGVTPLPEYPNILNSEKALFLTEKQVKVYPQFRDAAEEEILNFINIQIAGQKRVKAENSRKSLLFSPTPTNKLASLPTMACPM